MARLGSGGTITHSTVTANRATSAGGGLFVSNGTLVLEHSIIASNYGVGQDITGLLGAILLPRYNLIGSNDRTGLMEAPIGYPDANGNLIGGETSSRHIYPELAALADNGGPTKTHALLQNSPAVDAGDPTAVAGLSGIPEVDQRGAPFSRVANDNTSVGKRIDMGAYELQRPLACDFNRDLHCTIDDIDMLVSAIASESYNSLFDLTLDDLLDLLDRDAWLALAGAENLSSERPYLPGDANLDGFVSDMDLEIWNENKFTLAAAWSAADFNADGIVDVSDFSIWNSHKYLSSLARDVGDDLSTNLRSNSSVRTEAVELDEAAHPTSESDDDDFKVKRRLRGLRNLTLTPSSAK